MKSWGHGDLTFTWLISGRAHILTLQKMLLLGFEPGSWEALYMVPLLFFGRRRDPLGVTERRSTRLQYGRGMDGRTSLLEAPEHPGPCRRLSEGSLEGYEASPLLCHFRVCAVDLKGIQDDFFITKIVFGDLEKV